MITYKNKLNINISNLPFDLLESISKTWDKVIFEIKYLAHSQIRLELIFGYPLPITKLHISYKSHYMTLSFICDSCHKLIYRACPTLLNPIDYNEIMSFGKTLIADHEKHIEYKA